MNTPNWTYAAEHVPENREVPTPSGKPALPANDATPGLNARQDLRWPSPRQRRGLRPDNRRGQTRPRCTPRRWTSFRPGTCEATAGARLAGRFAARDARTVESAAMAADTEPGEHQPRGGSAGAWRASASPV